MLQTWLQRVLPSSFFNYGPQGLMWWQWLAIPALAVIALIIGRPLGAITRNILQRVFKRTRTTWDDRLLERVGGALGLIWAVAVFRLMLPGLALTSPEVVHRVLAALVVVATFWALWRSVDVFIEMLLERPWAVDNPSARSLVAVTGNFTRVALTIMGLLSTLSAFGLPVTTAVAGLGIGGIALAFGAQKTVADLFGSVAIAADRPCRVGDTVRVEDVVGVVEEIGVRSTRIRTPDRSMVSFPNGRLADMRIETLAVRDRIRFATMVGVVYGTSEQQLKQVLTGMEDVLRRHPHIWKDVITVRFAGFGATALEIEVQCWFSTPDYELFRTYRQDVLFGFLKVIEQAGTAISWPTHTVQLVAPHANPS